MKRWVKGDPIPDSWPAWLREADILWCDVEISDLSQVIWQNGIWQTGTWKNGVWQTGTWLGGLWQGGSWLGGLWQNGTRQNGLWQNGIWQNGIWRSGTWKDGFWHAGTWQGGLWESGTWESGTWQDGTWKNGIWKDGLWLHGLWQGGLWESGRSSLRLTNRITYNGSKYYLDEEEASEEALSSHEDPLIREEYRHHLLQRQIEYEAGPDKLAGPTLWEHLDAD